MLREITARALTNCSGSMIWNCNRIVELDFPSLQECSESSFNGINSLQVINISACKTIPEQCFANCVSLRKVEISPWCSVIQDYAFANCTSLYSINQKEEIDLREVSVLGVGAFSMCSTLKIVLVSIEVINEETFYGCTSLESINLTNVTTIRASAFESCTNLTAVSSPTVREMHERAFKGCISLQLVNFSYFDVLEGDEHFCGCTELTVINLGYLHHVHDNSLGLFRGCKSLEVVILGPIPPGTFGANVFIETGRSLITVDGTEVLDIALCTQTNDYSNYHSDRVTGEGCDEKRWKYLYIGQNGINMDACGIPRPEQTGGPDEAGENSLLLTVLSAVGITIIIIAMVVVTALLIVKRRVKDIKEESEKRNSMSSMVLYDFG